MVTVRVRVRVLQTGERRSGARDGGTVRRPRKEEAGAQAAGDRDRGKSGRGRRQGGAEGEASGPLGVLPLAALLPLAAAGGGVCPRGPRPAGAPPRDDGRPPAAGRMGRHRSSRRVRSAVTDNPGRYVGPSSACRISIRLVSGPSPPGTGVM
jgi:hypothetical protein